MIKSLATLLNRNPDLVCEKVSTMYLSVNKTAGLLIDFSLTVKAATLICISGRGSTISCAKEGKSGFIYNLVKS